MRLHKLAKTQLAL